MSRAKTSGSDPVSTGFVRSVLLRQAVVGVVAYVAVLLLAPWSLLLESEGLTSLWAATLEAGAFGVAVAALWSARALRESRGVFQALALEPESVQPADIGSLADLPFALTARFVLVGVGAAALLLVPGVRPGRLDDARAMSLALLTLTMVCSAAVVHFVVVRDATLRAIELSPLDPIHAWLETQAVRLAPQRQVVRKVLLAVVAPVALVSIGAVLVTHAHLRTFVEQSRVETALQLGFLSSVAPDVGLPVEGRDDAVAAAAAHGFFIRDERSDATGEELAPRLLPTGQLEVGMRASDGSAMAVRYSAELAAKLIFSGALIAACAVVLAALLGLWFGRSLGADLELATRQVATLGTDTVLRGEARVAGPARFHAVGQLGSSVEALAERFRVFAAAQQRALRAKAAAQRVKQLLFASVSHDLKSPLNAILGFADLVRDEKLSEAQAESLTMVSGRGRELYALIETILDAARVEAGQLKLEPGEVPAVELVRAALDKARDLRGGGGTEVILALAPDMPPLRADRRRGPAALAVLIAHAMASAASAPGRAIRVSGTRPVAATGDPLAAAARLYIEYVATGSRPSLLEMQLSGRSPSSSERGMVLRLSLARAIIELHGGRVEVGRGPHGAAVVSCLWPAGDSAPRSGEPPAGGP